MPTEPILIGAFGPPVGAAGTPVDWPAPEEVDPPGLGEPGAAAALRCPTAEAEDGPFGEAPPALVFAAPGAVLLGAAGAAPAPDAAGAVAPAAAGADSESAVAGAVAVASPAGAAGATVVWLDGVTPPAAWARSRSERCVPQALAATTAQTSAAEVRHVLLLNR